MSELVIPKRPCTPFVRFANTIRKEMPELKFQEVNVIATARWNALTDEERDVFKAEFRSEMDEHHNKMRFLRRVHGDDAVYAALARKAAAVHHHTPVIVASPKAVANRGIVLATLARKIVEEHAVTLAQALYAASQICMHSAGLTSRRLEFFMERIEDNFNRLDDKVRLAWIGMAKLIEGEL